MKAVMYHYVQPDSRELPYFRNLDLDEFRRQLDWFGQRFDFVGESEFLEVLNGHREPRENSVVLTFDDGLRDHFEFVFPELVRRRIWGIFYVTTGVFRTGRMLSVHLVHYLLGRFGGTDPLNCLLAEIDEPMLVNGEKFEGLTYTSQSNDDATRQFKDILNYHIRPDLREPMVRRVLEQFVTGMDEMAWYVDPAMLRDMNDAGMLIGNHSVSHPVFSTLGVDEQKDEIADGFQWLDEAVGDLRCRTFCFPYGGKHTYTTDTLRILDTAGCEFSFDVDPRDISKLDFEQARQNLPRYDCNVFPFGQCTTDKADRNS